MGNGSGDGSAAANFLARTAAGRRKKRDGQGLETIRKGILILKGSVLRMMEGRAKLEGRKSGG